MCGSGKVQVIIDATGNPNVGTLIALEAFRNGKHVVMLNVEADITIGRHLAANAVVGVPYTQEMIDNAEADMLAQATGENAEGLTARYPKAQARDYDGDPKRVSEMDALVAYLQMLGTLVDFSTFKAELESR